MSSGKKVSAERHEKSMLVPKLRFREFQGDPGWREHKLGDKALVLKGKGVAKGDVDPSGSQPCIRYGELYTRYGETIKEVVSRTKVPSAELFLSKVEDVIIPSSGESKIDIAKASCVLEADIALGGDLNVIRSELNGSFLSYYLNGPKRFDIAKVAQGDTVAHLYPYQIEALRIAVCSEAEQNRIAECLISLDDLIAAQTRKVDTLKAHKKGLMQQLFPREGETQPRLRFPEFQNSGEWEERRLEDLAQRGSGHTPSKSKTEYYNGGVKWVSLADSWRLDCGLISTTKIEISKLGIDNSSAVLHEAGSVLISRDAGIGKSAIMSLPMAVSQHFIVWTCNRRLLSNWFLYHLLQNAKPIFERAATGSTIKTIGLQFFIELRFHIPSLSEQKRIADCLTSLDELIAAQNHELDVLKTHKRGLMQQLFPTHEANES
jgi:type I restriction enzyme S subunit